MAERDADAGPKAGPKPDLARQARLLLREARAGTLATRAAEGPFASLVTPATAPDGSVLMLLSDLSEHTRHLRADGRCALMVSGEAEGPNPQTAPRVTVTGTATIDPDPALRARWVALHPYAAFYAGFADFNLWRLAPEGGLIVAGFGRARKLGAAALLPNGAAVAAVGHEEAAALARLGAAPAAPGGWTAVACDVDGIDLARDAETRTVRVAFPGPVGNAEELRAALGSMAGRIVNWLNATLDPRGGGQ